MCTLPDKKSAHCLNMVYTDCVIASQIRVAVNQNFVWKFLAENYEYHIYNRLPVLRITEKLEDYLNSIDLLTVSEIKVHLYLRKLIAESIK